MFLVDTYIYLWGYWISGDVSAGFEKLEWVLPYSLFAEANVMFIPQDPPLVLHVPTSWQPAQPVTSPHACAEVGLGSDLRDF